MWLKKKKALVIYNPMAGAKSWRIKETPSLVQEILKSHDYEYHWFETQKVDRQPLDVLFEKKYDFIIAIGGDGTVGEVASFMAEHKVKSPLIVIPQGTGNILAKGLMIPELSRRWALNYGLKHEGKLIDVMRVNQNYHALLSAGVGYDTYLMEKTTRPLKRQIGFFAYLWIFIRTFLFYKSKQYKLTIDGETHYVKAKSIIVMNMIPFGKIESLQKILRLFGENVLPDDGLLNIFILNPLSLWDLFSFRPKFQTFQGKNIVIKSKKERKFQLDGNVFHGKTITIQLLPKAISVVHK